MGNSIPSPSPSSTDKPKCPNEKKSFSETHSKPLESQLSQESGYGESISHDSESLSLSKHSTSASQISYQSDCSRRTDDEKYRLSSENSNSASSLNEPTEAMRYSTGDDVLFLNPAAGSSNSNVCPNCQNCENDLMEQQQTAAPSNTSSGYDVDNLCNDLLNEMIPSYSEKQMKVIILHVIDETHIAKELADHLRSKFGCRATSLERLNPLYRMCGPQSLSAAQKWADVLMIILSPSWIRAIKNVQPTLETDKETAKYHYKLLQADYMQCSCINHRIIPVITPGTDPNSFLELIEIKDSYTLDDIKENFESIIYFEKWSKRGKELVEKSLKKTSKLQVPD